MREPYFILLLQSIQTIEANVTQQDKKGRRGKDNRKTTKVQSRITQYKNSDIGEWRSGGHYKEVWKKSSNLTLSAA